MPAVNSSVAAKMSAFRWLILFMLLVIEPTQIDTQEDSNQPSAIITIIPEYTEEPRVGDNVTLDCEISSIQESDKVQWTLSRQPDLPMFIVDADGLTSNTDDRFSVSPLQLINSTTALYSHKLSIDPVGENDEGTYVCFVNRIDGSGGLMTIASTQVTLLIYPVDEFPSCFPNGQATVTVGSSLSCRTLSDARTPSVNAPGMPSADNVSWVMSPSDVEGSPGKELTRTVTSAENGSIFTCFSIDDDSPFTQSCTIGPLTVKQFSNAPDGGLSGADIAGIVIGVIFILVIIAAHTLCCRCNPRRWLHAKSYLFDRGSSFGTSSHLAGNTMGEQPDLELGNSEIKKKDAPPPPDESSTENGTETVTNASSSDEKHELDSTPEPQNFKSDQPDSNLNFAINMNINIGVSDPGEENKTKPNQSVIYAQMDKTATPTSSNNSTKEQKPKKVKSFGRNQKGEVEREVSPSKTEPVVVYADLDIPDPQTDKARRPSSTDSPTVYAAIKH